MPSAPRRCFLRNKDDSDTVRIMASLVGVDDNLLYLDDGTAQRAIHTQPHMLGQLQFQLGDTIEVVACRNQALSVAVLTDPHALFVRTLELTSTSNSSNRGYPIRSTPAAEIHHMIASCAPEGCTLEDLSEYQDIQAILTNLQLQGQVYQNEQGRYVPL